MNAMMQTNGIAVVSLTGKTRSPRSVRRAAMDCLARREHSFHELRQKLQDKCPNAEREEIEQELSRLREENLQSDERFADALVRYRQARGYGYLSIRQELQRRGIPGELISQVLKPDDAQWARSLRKLVSARINPVEPMHCGSRQHARLLRFLQARGFRDTEITEALSRLLDG